MFKDCYDKFSKLGLASIDEIIEVGIVNAATATLYNYNRSDEAELLENWDFDTDLQLKKELLNNLITTLTREISSVTSSHTRQKLTDALDYCKAILEKLDNVLSGMYAEEMYDIN